jgi:predicted nucleic acid-binding protein
MPVAVSGIASTRGTVQALVSTLTIAEIRAGLRPQGARNVWRAFVSHLLTSPNYRVEPVDVTIAEQAGQIRESSRISLPDAPILATGRSRDADCIITLDRELGRHQKSVRVCRPEEIP